MRHYLRPRTRVPWLRHCTCSFYRFASQDISLLFNHKHISSLTLPQLPLFGLSRGCTIFLVGFFSFRFPFHRFCSDLRFVDLKRVLSVLIILQRNSFTASIWFLLFTCVWVCKRAIETLIISMYIYVCVCTCVCFVWERERIRQWERSCLHFFFNSSVVWKKLKSQYNFHSSKTSWRFDDRSCRRKTADSDQV